MREIQALRRLSPHDHIISLEEVLYDQPTGRLALVFELMDANLYELIKGNKDIRILLLFTLVIYIYILLLFSILFINFPPVFIIINNNNSYIF